jgi:hypothetical protein
MRTKPSTFKKIIVLVMLFASWQIAEAQVTTSSMAGVVRSGNGETLPGATIIATHLPSGTTYGTTSSGTGHFNIQGMRVGGPYTVQVSFMGFQTQSAENITLSLGEPFNLNVTLNDGATALEGVTVVGERTSAFNTVRTGAVTNVNNQMMAQKPTISRNFTDIAGLSPYSTGSGSFVGRESFATNITIDGANFNNNFGLSGGGTPGVSGEPISMDAIEEMQVVVAPFDVRQSNFTGAGINAVTKSGSNTVKGTVYGFFNNQNMGGKKIRGKEISNIPEASKQIYGFSVGAPIIKNKLFIFLNGEINNETRPGNTLLAVAPGRDPNDPNVSNTVQASDLQAFSNFLKEKFGYETGRYESWGGDNIGNNKMLARIDWNVNNNHRVTARYNYSKSSNISRPSGSSDGGGAINPSRHSKTGGMSFENSQYSNEGTMHSLTGELNSRFSNQLSNNLLIAYTSYDQPRTTTSSIFPMVDIMRGQRDSAASHGGANSYMTAGYELFSYQNRVQNNTLIITNNATYQHGEHTFTGGLSFERQYFANSYLRNGTAYYRYKNFEAFQNHVNGVTSGAGTHWSDYNPIGFAYTYPINGHTEPKSELSFGQFAAYIQDEWSVRDNLKLTMGLRVDLPMYFDGAIDNPGIHGKTFRDEQTVDLSTWPDAKLLWSPRLGFNWDVHKDRSLTVRGGTGMFTGRIPFVWFTNQPGNSGMLQFQLNVTDQTRLVRIPFAADAKDLLTNAAITDIFPQENAVRGGRIAAIDKDFKLPQVWRTSLATDIKLPLDMMLTLEGIYTKDINAVWFDNININDPDSKILEGKFERDFYTAGRTYINTDVNADVVIMKNTKEGHGASLSAQLRLPNWNGLSGDIAYTFSHTKEFQQRSNGSDPFSAWSNRQTINSLNSTELGLSLMNTPHRLMVSLNYSIEYAKHFATTISLFYTGRTGNSYTYTYNGRPANFAVGTWVAYLPKEKNEVIWRSDADWDAYQEFIKNNPNIEKHLGDYAPKYGVYLPWTNRIDLRIAQDFKLKVNNTTHRLQFTADIMNFGNLLNSKWGIQDNLNGSFSSFPLLTYVRRDAETGKAVLGMNGPRAGEYWTSPKIDPSSQSATWAIQLGLRYSF